MYLAGEQPVIGLEQNWGALDTLRIPENPRQETLRLTRSIGGIATSWDVVLPPLELPELDMHALRQRIEQPNIEDVLDLIPVLPVQALDRVTINTDTGCWEMPSFTDKNTGTRYPLITSKELGVRSEGAHRVFYRQLVGDIQPEGFIDHRCLNKCCVYPRHVEDVTQAVNNRRARVDAIAKHQPALVIEL